jgi:hypothetical protein
VFISVVSVHDVPFQDSTRLTPVGASPAIANASVLLPPAPDKLYLPEFKSLTSVHAEPFHDSVTPVVG